MPNQRPPTIDPRAASRWQQRPAAASPWLHEELGRRMEARLDWIKQKPQAWAHWDPLNGGLNAHQLLVKRYPGAHAYLVDGEDARAQAAHAQLQKPWWQLSGWGACKTRIGLPPDGSVQLVWSNMALHMAADPQALLAQWHRALAVDGFVMFSCLGPDTLIELRELYRARGWPAPSHAFTDMHDWGDMLVAAGFAEPVMDMERLTLTYSSPSRLLEELRGLGRNLHAQRFAALRGRAWRANLEQALSAKPVRASFELIYGHAFKPAPRLALRPQSTISLADLKHTLGKRKTMPSES